jgi:hypothetical protein
MNEPSNPFRSDVPEIIEFDAAFETMNKKHAAAMPAARHILLQQTAADAYDELIHEASRLKKKVVERGDEDSAARLLCGECAAGAMMGTLLLWIAFKEGDMATAWNRMVDAQQAWRGALRAHPIGRQFRRLALIPFQVETVLFPHVAFMSAGMIVRQPECTICGETPGECDHIRGHVYGGKFAGVLVTEAELRETSLVDIPADKRCRVESITIDGVQRDALTWEIVNQSDNA